MNNRNVLVYINVNFDRENNAIVNKVIRKHNAELVGDEYTVGTWDVPVDRLGKSFGIFGDSLYRSIYLLNPSKKQIVESIEQCKKELKDILINEIEYRLNILKQF